MTTAYRLLSPDVCWFYGEKVLNDEAHCVLHKRGNLWTILITDPAPHHSGLYSLAAVNSKTEIWHSWRVSITGTATIE